jgi:hypothetical protein
VVPDALAQRRKLNVCYLFIFKAWHHIASGSTQRENARVQFYDSVLLSWPQSTAPPEDTA